MTMWEKWCFKQKRKKNSQGKDPKTFEENSQGRDPSTLERNSQGKDPRTLREHIQGEGIGTTRMNSQGEDPRTWEEPVQRWRVQKKRKEKEVERKEENVKEKGRKRNKSPRAKQVLGKSGRWLFLLLILMQNWFCVDAAAGRLEPEGEAEVPKIIIVSDAVRGTKVAKWG